MKRQNPSIFNDIVGPTMVGPSSSHTCGPSRIGFLCSQFINGKLLKATIEFAEKGAYTNMYKGQKSDLGFVNGLLGNRPENISLRNSFKIAEERGIDIEFKISDFEPIVPNIAKLTLESDLGEKAVLYSDSTGGGTVKLLKYNDFELNIVGDCYELLIFADKCNFEKLSEELKNIFKLNEGFLYSEKAEEVMINLKLKDELSPSTLTELEKIEEIKTFKVIKPILVVPSNRNVKMPFESAEELLKISEESNKELWELGIEYEMARSGWSKEQVWDYMKYVVETMEASIKGALKGDIDMNGIISPTAGKIYSHYNAGKPWIDMGLLNTGVPYGMATMEYSSAMGVVLCAPTGGSAGVFPGAILGISEKLNLTMEEKIKAMFVTAITGIVMSKDYNYSAELYGCQVEPGAASAMAASGLVYIVGGSTRQSLAAASCAIQNILGTICDPVAGLVQVPCISRNAMSVANAVVSANLILGGYDPLIPLDEAAETMFRVGKQLPSELRCTCNGGLCITKTGKRLAEEQEIRNNTR